MSSCYLSLSVVTGYGQKPWGGTFSSVCGMIPICYMILGRLPVATFMCDDTRFERYIVPHCPVVKFRIHAVAQARFNPSITVYCVFIFSPFSFHAGVTLVCRPCSTITERQAWLATPVSRSTASLASFCCSSCLDQAYYAVTKWLCQLCCHQFDDIRGISDRLLFEKQIVSVFKTNHVTCVVYCLFCFRFKQFPFLSHSLPQDAAKTLRCDRDNLLDVLDPQPHPPGIRAKQSPWALSRFDLF